MIVVDASALAEVLVGTADADAVELRLFRAGETLHAPHLIDIEIAQVVRRFVFRGEFDSRRGDEAMSALADLPLRRYPHRHLMARVWELRSNLSAYDATYIALAELLDVPLVTRDVRTARAAGHRARIEII